MKKRDLMIGLCLCMTLLNACNAKEVVDYSESQRLPAEILIQEEVFASEEQMKEPVIEIEEPTTFDEESWAAWEIEEEQLFWEDLMSVSLDELTETEIRAYQGDWYNENIKYPVIAVLPEENIRLYGYKGEYKRYQGVVLRIGDWFQVFDWDYMTGRGYLPELYIYDLDGDGESEIICVTNSNSGTGLSIDQLHILKKNKDGSYEDHVFAAADYEQQLQDAITFEYDKETGILHFRTAQTEGNELYHGKSDSSRMPEYVAYNNIIYFYFEENTLKLHSVPRLLGEGVLRSEFPFMGVRADIEYQNGNFTLGNISFTEEDYSLR